MRNRIARACSAGRSSRASSIDILSWSTAIRSLASRTSGLAVNEIAADRLPDISFRGAVVCSLGPDLVQGDDKKKIPEFLTSGDVVGPVDHSTKKASKHRLNEIVIIDAPGQILRGLRSCQREEPLGVPPVKKSRSILVAMTEKPEQGSIRTGRCRAGVGHLRPTPRGTFSLTEDRPLHLGELVNRARGPPEISIPAVS